jgi:hypothetical protein
MYRKGLLKYEFGSSLASFSVFSVMKNRFLELFIEKVGSKLEAKRPNFQGKTTQNGENWPNLVK